MKFKYQFLILTVSCIILIFLNGIQDYCNGKFRIDTITIGLLIFAFLPFLYQIVGTIKVGGTELQFRDYIRKIETYEQILVFLDAISSQKEWTFYKPRSGEEDLGHGLEFFIMDLAKNHEKKLNDKIEEWFNSENVNHKWFASEIVGHFRIVKFKDVCKNYFEGLNINSPWDNWRLNCLWAYSRLSDKQYETLILKLDETESEYNRSWMIAACNQMIRIETDRSIIHVLQKATEKYHKQ